MEELRERVQNSRHHAVHAESMHHSLPKRASSLLFSPVSMIVPSRSNTTACNSGHPLMPNFGDAHAWLAANEWLAGSALSPWPEPWILRTY